MLTPNPPVRWLGDTTATTAGVYLNLRRTELRRELAEL
jgi:hypothetical protein